MKRNFMVALTVAALSILTVSTSFAQDKVKADVPFAFRVGNASLSAGSYTVSKAADQTMLIQSSSAKSAAVSNYIGSVKLKPTAPKLIFHKYGNTYFLAEVWDGSVTDGMQLPETKREKELRASNWEPDAQGIVIVAMK